MWKACWKVENGTWMVRTMPSPRWPVTRVPNTPMTTKWMPLIWTALPIGSSPPGNSSLATVSPITATLRRSVMSPSSMKRPDRISGSDTYW